MIKRASRIQDKTGRNFFEMFNLGFIVACALREIDWVRPRTSHGPRITSFSHLHQIGMAISDYAQDHGDRPEKLSSLVPRYVPLDQISIFYVKSRDAQNQPLPADWATNPAEIDLYSSYAYLGTKSIYGIFAFEKTNLWKSSAPRSDKVAALYTDYHVEEFSKVKLCEMLSGK